MDDPSTKEVTAGSGGSTTDCTDDTDGKRSDLASLRSALLAPSVSSVSSVVAFRGEITMRLPRAAITDWIFRTLQSCISLCEFVMLGLPILEREYILALEYQTNRLLWLTNELRHRTHLDPIDTPRTEFQMRVDGELTEYDELPYVVVMAPPSDYQIER